METSSVTRRSVLKGMAAASLLSSTALATTTTSARDYRLVAKPASIPLVGAPHPETTVWAYNDMVPGPEIRVPQGSRISIALRNELPEGTTVHCHGIDRKSVV